MSKENIFQNPEVEGVIAKIKEECKEISVGSVEFTALCDFIDVESTRNHLNKLLVKYGPLNGSELTVAEWSDIQIAQMSYVSANERAQSNGSKYPVAYTAVFETMTDLQVELSNILYDKDVPNSESKSLFQLKMVKESVIDRSFELK